MPRSALEAFFENDAILDRARQGVYGQLQNAILRLSVLFEAVLNIVATYNEPG
jgi:hypothetical protein